MGVSEKGIEKLKIDISEKETEETRSFFKRWSGILLLLFFFLGIGYFWGNKTFASLYSQKPNFATSGGAFLQFNADELSWGKVSVLLDDHPRSGIIISYGTGIPKDTIYHSGGYTKLVMEGKPLFLKKEENNIASKPNMERRIVDNILSQAVPVKNEVLPTLVNYSVPSEYSPKENTPKNYTSNTAPSQTNLVVSTEEVRPLDMGTGGITFSGNTQENSPIYFQFSNMKVDRKYQIEFGDDTGIEDFHNNKFHAYEKPGIYTVRLHESSGNHEYVYRTKVSVYSEPSTWLKAAGAVKKSGINEVVKTDKSIASASGNIKKASSIPPRYKVTTQGKVNKDAKKIDEVVLPTKVETMPSFPGGSKSLSKFIKDGLVYPEIAREFGKKGIVQVQFVVEETGAISNIKVLNGIGYGCDEAAVKLISSMPNWSPGIDKGEKTKVAYTLPIEFK